MGVRRLVNDLSYRMYDRMRHRNAYEVAAQPATAADLSSLEGRKYAVLVTYKRDGTAVPTPVWFGLDEGRMYIGTEGRTAKVARVRNHPSVRVFASDARGKPIGPVVEATARVLEEGPESERAEAAIAANYGASRRIYERMLMHGQGGVYIEVSAGA